MNMNEKSRTVSFFLTLFFGPLGLLYASVGWSLALIVLAVATALTVVGPFVVWVLAIAIGDHLVHRHNQSVEKFVRLMTANRAA